MVKIIDRRSQEVKTAPINNLRAGDLCYYQKMLYIRVYLNDFNGNPVYALRLADPTMTIIASDCLVQPLPDCHLELVSD